MSEHPFAEPINPYSPPSAEAQKESHMLATPLILQLLSQTRPWVFFLSILGFLGSGLMVLGGIVGAFATFAMGQGPSPTEGLVIFGIYAVMGVIYVIPSYFLLRYALRIGDVLREATADRLAAALQAQTSFWRFVGILTALFIIVYCLAAIGIGIAGVWSM